MRNGHHHHQCPVQRESIKKSKKAVESLAGQYGKEAASKNAWQRW
jgi:hypothetical protein